MAPPTSHGLASTCWQPQPLAEPLPPPRRSPLRDGVGALAGPRAAQHSELGSRWASPARRLSFAKCQSGMAARRLGGGAPTHLARSPWRRGEVRCARPQPDNAGNLGSSRAPGGDAAESWPRPKGRRQVAGGDGWVCVPSRRGQEGGGKPPSQLQVLREQSNFACAAPLPRPGQAGGCAAPGGPAPGPAGHRPACGRGCRGGPGAGWGVRLHAPGGLETTRGPHPESPPGGLGPRLLPGSARGRGRRTAAEPWKLCRADK